MKAIAALLTVFLTTPIWFYLVYKILQMVGATDVMWLLYWVYLPICIFSNLIFKIVELSQGAKS